MCCLKNEEEAYVELNKKLPNIGEKVITIDNLKGEVQRVSVLKQRVKVIVDLDNDEKEIKEYHVDELKFKSRRRGNNKIDINDEELRILEKLEKDDSKKSRLDDA